MTGKREREPFATEIINEIAKQRNRWRLVALISIALNIIQWVLWGSLFYEPGNGAPTSEPGGIIDIQIKKRK